MMAGCVVMYVGTRATLNQAYTGPTPTPRGANLPPGCVAVVTVQEGQTLSEIAFWTGVSEYALLIANPAVRQGLAPGMQLCIPDPAALPQARPVPTQDIQNWLSGKQPGLPSAGRQCRPFNPMLDVSETPCP